MGPSRREESVAITRFPWRALHRLGIFAVDPQVHAHRGRSKNALPAGYAAEWGQWTDRFATVSVEGKAAAKQLRYFLHFVGRRALTHHEEASRSPADWDVEIAADFAAFVSNGKLGDLERQSSTRDAARSGTPFNFHDVLAFDSES